MSRGRHRPGTRVEDLVSEPGAREMLRGTGVEPPASGPLPLALPCRAVRVAPSGPDEASALAAAAGGGGAQLVRGPGACLIAGPAPAIDETVARLAGSGPEGEALAAVIGSALAGFRRRGHRLRFADGEAWDLDERTRVMGVVNVTPDSFSDGGRWATPESAVEHGRALADDGADIVDIGGESSRPGARPVSAEDELGRVLPTIEGLRRACPRLRLSVDTVKAEVARRAVEAGADAINDISGLRSDPALARVAAEAEVPLVLMHMRGEPATMQSDTRYDDLLTEIVDRLAESCGIAEENGIADGRLVVDPGIGFGKAAEGNEEILRHLPTLRTLGLPILVGASRKSFIGLRQGGSATDQRLEGSLAAAAAAIRGGAQILRVHDVRATVRLAQVTDAIELV